MHQIIKRKLLVAHLLVGVMSVCCLAPNAMAKNTAWFSSKACPAQMLQAKRPYAEHQGKWVYVDFWASWCGPCRDTFPFMNALKKEYGDKLEIVAISVDEQKAPAQAFLKAFSADFDTYIDTQGVCPETFNIKGMPASYLISPQGKLVFSETGFTKSSPQHVRAALKKFVK